MSFSWVLFASITADFSSLRIMVNSTFLIFHAHRAESRAGESRWYRCIPKPSPGVCCAHPNDVGTPLKRIPHPTLVVKQKISSLFAQVFHRSFRLKHICPRPVHYLNMLSTCTKEVLKILSLFCEFSLVLLVLSWYIIRMKFSPVVRLCNSAAKRITAWVGCL